MFDFFCIFTTDGEVLWSKTFVEVNIEIIEKLVKDVILEEKTGLTQYTVKDYIVKFKIANDLKLVFAAVYNKIIHLTMVDELVDMIQADFRKKMLPELDLEDGLVTFIPTSFDDTFDKVYTKWDIICKEAKNATKPKSLAQSLAEKNKKKRGKMDGNNKKAPGKDETSKKEDEDVAEESKLSKFEQAKKRVVENSKKKSSKGAPEEETKTKGKEGRQWEFKDKVTYEDIKKVDRSKAATEESTIEAAMARYAPGDGEDNPDYWSSDEEDEKVESSGGLFSRFTNSIRSYIGNKTISEEDLNGVMEEFADGLVEKNVAQEIAASLCDSIKNSLVNTKTKSFTTVNATAKTALTESLKKILTPKRKIDILEEALAAKKSGEPYKIVFIGVNGVGKSTTLAKVGYYLKTKGKLSPIIAACDNFRAGAVEQLKVHSKCLDVPLYDQGYKGDPAYIASEAIAEAKKKGYDVVLIDTAGRMQGIFYYLLINFS